MNKPNKQIIDTGNALITVDFIEHRSGSLACICYVNNISIKSIDLELPRLRSRFAASVIAAADGQQDSEACDDLLHLLDTTFGEDAQ